MVEIKRSNAELIDAFRRMTVGETIKSCCKAQGIEANLSSEPQTGLLLRSQFREYSDYCKMEGHNVDYCWRKHPAKHPVALAQISFDIVSSKIVKDIRDILEGNEKKEKKLPSNGEKYSERCC